MHNIGDLVYIYLFDLEKTIIHMNQLREDRFGRIVSKTVQEVYNTNFSNQTYVYEIQLRNKQMIRIEANDVKYRIIDMPQLIELIGSVDLSADKKRKLLEQVNKIIQD